MFFQGSASQRPNAKTGCWWPDPRREGVCKKHPPQVPRASARRESNSWPTTSVRDCAHTPWRSILERSHPCRPRRFHLRPWLSRAAVSPRAVSRAVPAHAAAKNPRHPVGVPTNPSNTSASRLLGPISRRCGTYAPGEFPSKSRLPKVCGSATPHSVARHSDGAVPHGFGALRIDRRPVENQPKP